jgi:predicted outer membrane lipoprotein
MSPMAIIVLCLLAAVAFGLLLALVLLHMPVRRPGQVQPKPHKWPLAKRRER